MEKQKILGISSEEYPNGRVDIFKILLSEDLVFVMEGLFKDLGFNEKVVNDLDMHYPSTKGYYFFYSPRIKAHMFFEDNVLNLIFDSKIPKRDISNVIKKYFEFPETVSSIN
ncbi:MAG: hypothetical protein KKF74_02230 [Nanoarchaeota archaeon]|nr:hypothetical protein [Nanoarchaeota archaeon]